ncbi:MAG: succinate dehydrogenase/fumarate reductase cytochrome b subunit [Bacteroidales bacterium]|jgi:succinate dehydrogenase / fumarate reductase cytochrome b subunit|nr:succinate dehydrogenase/fumarate reductase cytochrome b subunit [Bacteroidales bacterium]
MWLISSSIGRKVVMSVTGTALVLFLTFHMLMNLVYVYDVMVGTPADGHYFDAVCEFLGTNWYALLGTAGLAALVLIHFCYAFMLTLQNWKARGNDRYAVSGKQPVHWAAKNMLALGVVVICGMLVHLWNFWRNMMLAELTGTEAQFAPASGFDWITFNLSDPVLVVIYIVWFAALWYHLTHGIWSAMQTLGLNGKIWLNRWICISYIWATVIAAGFLCVLVAAIIQNGGFSCTACCPA